MSHKSWHVNTLLLVGLFLLSTPARADALQAAGHFFFTTMEKRFAGEDRYYKRYGNTLETNWSSEGDSYLSRVSQINRCTYKFDFIRPPTIATRSTSMQIDFSGYKRANMTQSKAGKSQYDAVKFTGIKACNLGEHLEYWNNHIAPGSCSDTFFEMIGGDPERQRIALDEMIRYCQKGK